MYSEVAFKSGQEDNDLEKKIRVVEARTRMVYNNRMGTLDMSKRRVMDLPRNSKFYLHPPLNPTTEAGLAVKK